MGGKRNLPRASQFSTIDSEYRIKLPEKVCEMLDIKEGTRFLIIADKSKTKIILYPIILGEEKFAELYMKLRNIPGVLGVVATELGKMNINIESTVVPPSFEEISDFYAIINFTECKTPIVEVEKKLRKLKNTIEVEIIPIE